MACSGIRLGSVRIDVEVLSRRSELKTAGERERQREGRSITVKLTLPARSDSISYWISRFKAVVKCR